MDIPNASEIKARKRKRRAVLSCNDCRRRKLKCDRELPCNRCINGGISNACAYGRSEQETRWFIEDAEAVKSGHGLDQTQLNQDERPAGGYNSAISPDDATLNEGKQYLSQNEKWDGAELLERRIASLEAQLSSLSNTHALRIPSATNQPLPIPGSEENVALPGLFKGRGYCTFAYGPTSPTTIVFNFPQLSPFMKSVYPNSTLARLRGDMQALEERARLSNVAPRVLTVPYLRSLLPDRTTVELLTKRYFDTFETTYRIIHIPTFWADFQTFWDSPPGSDSDMEAVLLAVLACVLCTSTHESTKYNPSGSNFRSKAIIWIKACEAWLKRQSNKHRTLATLQVRCLRLLAIKTTCLKTKEFYQEVQAHMGFMKAIGFHRDPSVLGNKCSVFEGEMRRRLWATTLELEIQASIDRGTPSILSSLDYDCTPPTNINDSDIHKDIVQIPESLPMAVFTDTSFLHCLTQTAALRIKLCKLTNSLRCSLDFPDILQYEQAVQDALEKLPKWSDPRSLQAWTHLDLHLRQFLVILHTPRVLQTPLRARTTFRLSLLTALESSVTLIERHTNLVDSGNFALCCIRSDYYRAALLLCHIAYHACGTQNEFLLRIVKLVFEDAIEKALRLQEESSMRPGRGSHQYWYLSAAASLVQTRFEPEHEAVLRMQVTDRISKLFYKILSLQEDHGDEYLANEVILSNGYPAPQGEAPETSTFSSDTFTSGRLDSFEFPDTSEWLLDDFWSLNDFPLLPFGN
ncbi:uncharacterized protein BDR25DRAFT_280869 [Lindgomyces ingoldianus]|uniref:Uncharacterized protein n=1 Tax=Lindgomyces ingoldianus TaxID=673940 RepID=A0ACB6R475_9PLEO|nr:uncharacterized protein BDR25DRAFT_280869 [Lindgomyces ingoldianus]KAF2474124.1 hypothetical protein BDR25DRAFT_280869 [Lindgomyces ingoldianus]